MIGNLPARSSAEPLTCRIVLAVSTGREHTAEGNRRSLFEIIGLTWGGAMGIRTPDLLHAITRQPVLGSPSSQATVLLCFS